MKVRQSKFKELKGLLDPMRIIYYPLYKDDLQNYSDPIIETDSGKYLLCIVEKINGILYPISIDAKFSDVRDEVISNISMPIDKSEKGTYLNEIIDFYSSIEDKIVEDNKGQLTFDFHIFLKHHSRMELYPEEFHFFLDNLKDNLRNEINFLDKERLDLLKTSENYQASKDLQYKLIWNRSDTALLELIIALHEQGAIQNLTKDLLQKEAIEAFLNFFDFKIKDQYKKLNSARYRAKEDSSFISKLQKALEAYYLRLEEETEKRH